MSKRVAEDGVEELLLGKSGKKYPPLGEPPSTETRTPEELTRIATFERCLASPADLSTNGVQVAHSKHMNPRGSWPSPFD